MRLVCPHMSDSASSEYSLWLTFDEGTDANARYRDTIADLAAAHADAPTFNPHVTVLGGVVGTRETLVETTRSLSSGTQPIDVEFGAIRCSTTTYQTVFRLVEPTADLFELYKAARDAVGVDPGPYNPHVSLLYSGIALDKRLAVADAIDPAALPEAGRLTTLELVATAGPVAAWEPVYSVKL